MIEANFLDSNNTAYWDGYQCKHNADDTWSCPGETGGLISTYSKDGASYSGGPYPYVYDENAVNIYPVVTSYANKLSGLIGTTVSGRLISYEEATNLSADISKDMNGSFYYVASAQSGTSLFCATHWGSIQYCGSANAAFGIRPVIIVPTSAL